MIIDSVSISGFANIPNITIDLSDMTALIAPNGYGKSNVLKALEFGCRFVSATEQERLKMMAERRVLPINRSMLRQNFRMEITGSVGEFDFEYGYTFRWADEGTEGAVSGEWLRIKHGERKYRQALSRNSADGYTYLSSVTGRCTNAESATAAQLALNKLTQIKELFYIQVVKGLAGLTIPLLDTLDNPDSYFSADTSKGIALLDGQTLSEYLYNLKKRKPMAYSVLADGILTLIPHLKRFEPTEIVLADGRTRLYDILIEERNAAYPASISQISSGSKRVMLLFTLCVAAREKGLPLLMVEEPENSVHPRLLENLLLAMHDYAGETKVLMTSHSPYLMRYLTAGQMLFGLPNANDVARFAKLRNGKVKTIARYASTMELTIGEYMFDFMLDLEQEPEKIETFFQEQRL